MLMMQVVFIILCGSIIIGLLQAASIILYGFIIVNLFEETLGFWHKGSNGSVAKSGKAAGS